MTTIRRGTDADHDRLFDLIRQAFNRPESEREVAKKRRRPERALVAEEDGVIVATSASQTLGHAIGGRWVPAQLVYGVAVDPAARGRGLGTTLVQQLHDEARVDGIPVATLYPATLPIYRKLGYGDAMFRASFSASLGDLPLIHDAGALEVLRDDDLPVLREAYERLALRTNGPLQRDEEWWQLRIVTDDAPYRYVFREDGEITGWVIYGLRDGKDDWRSTIGCRDLWWESVSAGRALLAFAHAHRATQSKITWYAQPDEALYQLVRDHAIANDGPWRVMGRILDVPGALGARGYLAAINAEVTFAVDDPIYEDNRGPWRLSVSKGEASVEATTVEPDARVTINTLSSFLFGFLRPLDAARTGSLTASPDAIERLEAIFAGPIPWASDFY